MLMAWASQQQQPEGAGGLPAIGGSRILVIGDSRVANGITPLGAPLKSTEGALSPFTGVVQRTGTQGIPTWLCEAISYKLRVISHISLGGHNSARFACDEAIALGLALNPDVVLLYCGNNDVGTVFGYSPIPLGDPDADPSTNAAVGAMPAAPGTGLLGTTLGNLHKIITAFEAANIPVIAWETPKSTRNAYIQKWYNDQANAGTYSNFYSFNAYALVSANPSELNNPATAAGLWTTAYSALGDITTSNDGLHPSTIGARLIGEALASDPVLLNAIAALPSNIVLPDGTNSAAFLNSNPYLLMGTGTGTRNNGITGQLPTGLTCRQTFSGGTVAVNVDAIAAGQGVRFTVNRTGGSGTTPRIVGISFIGPAVTPVAGDAYVLEGEFSIPARNPADILQPAMLLNCSEPGLVDQAGTSIATTSFQTLGNSIFNFPTNGQATFKGQSAPFVMTPSIVASATGTLTFSCLLDFNIRENIDTVANGVLILDILSLGLRKTTV